MQTKEVVRQASDKVKIKKKVKPKIYGEDLKEQVSNVRIVYFTIIILVVICRSYSSQGSSSKTKCFERLQGVWEHWFGTDTW